MIRDWRSEIDFDHTTEAPDLVKLRQEQHKVERLARERLSNMPTHYIDEIPRPISFGDERSRRLHEKQLARARERQNVRYAVAPGSSVRTDRGKILVAGDEVRPGDIPIGRLAELVRFGRVIERDGGGDDGFDPTPRAA